MTTTPALKAALNIAGHGFKVFPCAEGKKAPATRDGFHSATLDPATIKAWWRKNSAYNIAIATGLSGLLVVDVDTKNGQDGFSSLKQLKKRGLPVATLTTKTPSGGVHLYFKTSETVPSRTGLFPGIDVKSDRGYVLCPPSIFEEKPYRWVNPDAKIQPAPHWLIDLIQDSNSKKNKSFVIPEKIIEGSRNETLFKAACSLQSKNLSPQAVHAALSQENLTKCYPPLPEHELITIINSVERYRHESPQIENLSDSGNAERFCRLHGDRVRYVVPFKRFIVYDGTRWIYKTPAEMLPLAVATVRAMNMEAQTLPDKARRSLTKYSLSSEAVGKLKAMMEIAGPMLAIEPCELDKNPFLFNVNNGTLDLRTGKLLKHSPENFITKLSPVAYDRFAKCPLFMKFLDRILDENKSLIVFLQRSLGYSLTGSTQEQSLFFLYGSGANGKSVLLNTIRNLVGDYGTQSPPELLLAQDRRAGAASPDIARLVGSRFVATSEVEDGQRFAESVIKALTGGDTVAARNLNEGYFEYKPQFKIWIAANHRPEIRGTDEGIWRRIKLLPFSVAIPPREQDHNLESKLVEELPGILAWVLKGCMAWKKNGLQSPPVVCEAVREYRSDMDVLGTFIEEECERDAKSWTKHGDLYTAYRSWIENNMGGGSYLSSNKFGRALKERGYTKRKTPDISWKGVRLKKSDLTI